MNIPEVSIIIPAKNEGSNVKKTLESIRKATTNISYELIVVDDGSDDGCCDFLRSKARIIPLCKLLNKTKLGSTGARNAGAEKAHGTYLIFCDAHLEFADYWIDQLIEPLQTNKTDAVAPAIYSLEHRSQVGYGMTLDSEMRIRWNQAQHVLFPTAILPGACLAMSKKIFFSLNGFERKFKVWGHEDTELSIHLWLFGYRCHIRPDTFVGHLFRKSFPYPLQAADRYYNFIRMAYLHFNEDRIEKCMKLLPSAAVTYEIEVIRDGVLDQREAYWLQRKYDDDWYMKKFDIPF